MLQENKIEIYYYYARTCKISLLKDTANIMIHHFKMMCKSNSTLIRIEKFSVSNTLLV